jgi:hypothetical protein
LILSLAALTSRAAPLLAAESETAVAPSKLVERFRFHAGAALLAPAGVAADGAVCVGTADGYVHSLGPDGSFRWSRSVSGAVIRQPILSGQLWFIVTNTERIFALTPEGNLAWVFKPPSAIASELAVDATGVSYFVAADQYLYGISAHGGVCLRAAFGALKAGPARAADGTVWAENQAGSVISVRGPALRHVTAASAEFDFGSPDELRDPDGHVWRARADGVLEFRSTPSAPARSLQLTPASLLRPAWSAAARGAVISARDGLVVLLELPRDAHNP